MTYTGYGMTIPFDGVPLHAQRDWITELADLGYTDVWSSEANGADAFTPLALASVWAPSLRLGIAIVPAFTRGPATPRPVRRLAGRRRAGPGRVRHRHVVRRDRRALERHPVRGALQEDPRHGALPARRPDGREGEAGLRHVLGQRLQARDRAPSSSPSILVAALREGMLRLAGREGDGAIINWLGADDVAHGRAPRPRRRRRQGDRRPDLRGPVRPTPTWSGAWAATRSPPTSPSRSTPSSTAGSAARSMLQPMWDHWAAGDRKAALAAIPDELVDALIVHGSPEECREHIGRYVANGVTSPALAILPFGLDPAPGHPRPRAPLTSAPLASGNGDAAAPPSPRAVSRRPPSSSRRSSSRLPSSSRRPSSRPPSSSRRSWPRWSWWCPAARWPERCCLPEPSSPTGAEHEARRCDER